MWRSCRNFSLLLQAGAMPAITIEKLLPDLGLRHFKEIAAISTTITDDGTIEETS
jgi:hypothetical protein